MWKYNRLITNIVKVGLDKSNHEFHNNKLVPNIATF